MADDQRTGIAGVLGGIAAIIAAVAALVGVFHKSDVPTPVNSAKQSDAVLPNATVSPVPPASSNTHVNAIKRIKQQNAPDPHPPVAKTASIEGYWSGTPTGIPMPVVFHFIQQGQQITGTLQSPCQSPFATPIDSASWDGSHLTVHISQLGQGFNPVTVDVDLRGEQLRGSFVQIPNDISITLHKGKDTCPTNAQN